MFVSLLKSESTRLTKRTLFWIEIAAVAGMLVVIFSALIGVMQTQALPADEVAQIEGSVAWPSGILSALSFMSGQSLGGLLMIVLVGVVVAQDYDWQVFSLWLRQGATRPAVLLGKFLILIAAALAFVFTALLVSALLSLAYSATLGGGVVMDGVNWAEMGLSILRTAYTLLPYLSFAFLIAVLTRSVAGTIGIGIAYALLVESVMRQIMLLFGAPIADLSAYLPGAMAQVIAALNTNLMSVTVNGEAAGAGLPFVETNIAIAGIAIYTLIFMGLALWRFTLQDLTV